MIAMNAATQLPAPTTWWAQDLADAINAKAIAEYNRIEPTSIDVQSAIDHLRGVIVRYARRADLFSLELLRHQRRGRVAMRCLLREHLAIDRRQARTLARRLGRLQQRFGEPEACR